MIIDSICLNNFRQYKGQNNILFSTDSEKNITIITGENTCGKTTLVQSFIWCLYGKIDFKDKDILNAEIREELERSTVGAFKYASVMVRLTHNSIRYLIERKNRFQLDNKNKISISQDFKIYEIDSIGNTCPVDYNNYDAIISDILPENLSDYFFFWGERIEKLSEKKELTSAVKQFLGLDTMDSSIRHLTLTVNKLIRDSTTDSNDSEIERFNKRISVLEEKNASLDVKIHNSINNINYYSEIAEKYFAELTTSENRELQSKQDEYKKKLSQLETKKSESENAKTNFYRHFNDENNYVYLLASFSEKKAVELLKNNPEPVVGWNYIDVNSINEIIKRKKCICGKEFCEGDNTFTHLIEQRKLVAPNLVGGVINSFIEESERRESFNRNYFEMLRNDYKQISTLSDEILDLEYDKDLLLKNISGKKDMKEVHKKYMECRQKESDEKMKLSSYQTEKRRNDEEIALCNKNISNLMEKNKKFLKQSKAINYAKQVLNIFKEDYQENETVLKTKLEDYVNKNFDEVYSGDRKIRIDDKYNAVALNKVGNTWIASETSPGLETVKNFAFIAGLVQCAKEKIIGADGSEEANPNSYPLVLDAPFSQADEKHVPAISKLISKNAEQIILVVMKKDWNYAKDVLKYKVGRSYNLEKVSETHTFIREVNEND